MKTSAAGLRAFSTVSALALAATLVLPTSARAEAVCTPQDDGSVLCTADEQPFPTGINYTGDTDVRLQIADGLTIAPDAGNAPVILNSWTGSVTIEGPNADLKAVNSSGIAGYAAQDFTVVLRDVETSGELARGIDIFSSDGRTSIEANSISTSGGYAVGIVAGSSTGDIAIDVGKISTEGFAADGMMLTTGGNIDVHVDEFTGRGDYIWGVNAFNGNYVDEQLIWGNTNIDIGKIDIAGNYNAGIVATSYGGVNVHVGEIKLDGDSSAGVQLITLGDINVDVGTTTITGQGSGGIVTLGEGQTNVRVGTITTEDGVGVAARGGTGVQVVADEVHTNGAFANAVQAASNYGNATVRVNEASSNGEWATTVNVEALRGNVIVEAGKITAQGTGATGLRIFGKTTATNALGPIQTGGDFAYGILNSTTYGDAIALVAGPVTTSGYNSDALWITSRYGTADIRTAGLIATTGVRAHGIRAHGEHGQISIQANTVRTSGEASDGIRAHTRYVEFFLGQTGGEEVPADFTGNIDILAGDVSVTGTGSMGISARGLGAARIVAGSSTAKDNYAIETNMIGNSSIDVRRAATSELGSAILATGKDVDLSIGTAATVAGGVDGIIVRALGTRCVLPNPEDGVSRNPCPNPGDEYGNPEPAFPEDDGTGLGGSASIVNAGTLRGGSGYAVRVLNGTLELRNQGILTGGVLLGSGDDLIDNSGKFVVTKTSDFGAGTDLFRNSGSITLTAANAAGQYRFNGLERLENSGIVDLRNGTTGDSLAVSGNFDGKTGSTLGLDVDLTKNIADKFVVAGIATGKTVIDLNLMPSGARLTGSGGLALVEVGAGSAADAFQLADNSQDIGFIRYGLRYDPAARRYLLEGAAGAGAYRQLVEPQAMETLWHATADLWRGQFATSVAAGQVPSEGKRFWATVHGGHSRRDWSTALASGSGTADLDYRQDRYGGQAGLDLVASESAAGQIRMGVTGGYTQSDVEFRRSPDALNFSTINAGLYAGIGTERLFATALAKFDRSRIKVEGSAFEGVEKLKGSTVGIELEGGARFGSEGIFIEPVAGFAWTRSDIDDLTAGDQSLTFAKPSSFRGRIGARIGGTTRFGNDDRLSFSLKGSLINDFGGNYRAMLSSGGTERLSADRIGTYLEAVGGVRYRSKLGFEVVAEAQGELSGDYRGFSGRAGIALPF